MGGGITKGTSILFISPSGIERDIFISNILTNGLSDGFSLLMVLSKEPPRSIRMLLRSQGLDANRFEEEGNLRIVDWFSWRGERIIGVEKEGYALKSSKILSNLGIAINKGLREMTFSPNKVALVHMIGPATNIFEFTQVYNFIQRLRAKFKEEEMASIFFLESESMSRENLSRIMEVFDGVVEMSKTLEAGKIRREVSVLTMSGVDFDASPVSFIIRDNKLVPLDIIEKDEKQKMAMVIGPGEKVTRPSGEEGIEGMDEVEFELLSETEKNGNIGSPEGAGEGKRPAGGGRNGEGDWTEVKVRKDPGLAGRIDKVMSRGSEEKEGGVFRKKIVRKKKGTLPAEKVLHVTNDMKDKRRIRPIINKEEAEDERGKKPKKVRKLINIHNREVRTGPQIDFDKLNKPEDILMEAIATIDDILEDSEEMVAMTKKKGAGRIVK